MAKKKTTTRKKTAASKSREGWRKYGKAKIKAAIKGSGGFKTRIASNLGCSRTTLNKYIDELPELQEWLDDEDCLLGDVAESKLHGEIKEGNLTAIIFYLKTKQQKRGYVEKQVVDNTSSDGTMKPASPEEHAKAVAAATDRILAKYHGIDDKAV